MVVILNKPQPHSFEKPRLFYDVDYRVNELASSMQSRDAQKSYLARCKEDIAYFINTASKTSNPREKRNQSRPMLLDMRQVELLQHIELTVKEGWDNTLLKSRYVGGSWLYTNFGAHNWLFTPEFRMLMGSRTDDLVESKGDGEMKALFTKFDYIIDNLPPLLSGVLLKAGYKAAPPYKVEMLRKNPANGSTIFGEAMTRKFGRGPRATIVLLDELSASDFPEDAWNSCGQTGSTRHAVATPLGKDFFYGLCYPDEYADMTGRNRAEVQRPERFRIHWKDCHRLNEFLVLSIPAKRGEQWRGGREYKTFMENLYKEPWKILQTGHGYVPGDELPRGMGYHDAQGNVIREDMRYGIPDFDPRMKSVIYPWYEEQRLRYNEQEAAQELDIDFEKSKGGRVYSVQAALITRRPKIERISEFPLYYSVDPGRRDKTSIGWYQWNPDRRKYQWLRHYKANGRSFYYYIPLLTGKNEHFQLAEQEQPDDAFLWLFEEFMNPAWRVNSGAGDPSGLRNTGTSAKTSCLTILGEYGIPIVANYNWHKFEERLKSARRVMAYTEMDMVKCARILEAIDNIAFKEVSDTQQVITVPQGWVHHSAFADDMAMFEYAACHDPHRYETEEYALDSPSRRYDEVMKRYGSKPGNRYPGREDFSRTGEARSGY